MSLRDMIDADVDSVFLNTDDFAEVVFYYPRYSLAPRPISAVVFRNEASPAEESGGAMTPIFEVHVGNNADGILSTAIDLGGDTIGIPVRIGLDPVKRRITSVDMHDDGMLVLTCQ